MAGEEEIASMNDSEIQPWAKAAAEKFATYLINNADSDEYPKNTESYVATLAKFISENSPKVTTGAVLIAAERLRQIEKDKWTPQHDDYYSVGQLATAAICYTEVAVCVVSGLPLRNSILGLWPWDYQWWKPSADPIRNLIKAGALISAEIDRLQRRKAAEGVTHV